MTVRFLRHDVDGLDDVLLLNDGGRLLSHDRFAWSIEVSTLTDAPGNVLASQEAYEIAVVHDEHDRPYSGTVLRHPLDRGLNRILRTDDEQIAPHSVLDLHLPDRDGESELLRLELIPYEGLRPLLSIHCILTRHRA